MTYSINRKIRIFPDIDSGRLVIMNPFTNKTFISEVDPILLLKLFVELGTLHSGTDILDCIKKHLEDFDSEAVFKDLINFGFLVENPSSSENDTSEMWNFYGWEDLLFYLEAARDQKTIESAHAVSDWETVRAEVYEKYNKKKSSPSFFKKYDGRRVILKNTFGGLESEQKTYFESIFSRRTVRHFLKTPLTLNELSFLMYYGFYETRKRRVSAEIKIKKGDMSGYSDSRLCAFEAIVVVHEVEGIKAGIYGYEINKHELIEIELGDHIEMIRDIIIGQGCAKNAAISVFLTAIFERIMWRYRHPNNYKKILIGIAEQAQQLIVTASSIGLGSFQTPAIRDELAAGLLKTEPLVEEPMYFLAFGRYDSGK